jgi:hypothetical protein
VREAILRMPVAFFPSFFLEFYKNAKKIEWYLRIEGEGYRRLETFLDFSSTPQIHTMPFFNCTRKSAYEVDVSS